MEFRPSASPEMPGSGRHLVLYDGTCGLCHWTVQAILARDPDGRFAFAALQSPFARRVLDTALPLREDTIIVIENFRTEGATVRVQGRAALFIASELGSWRSAARLLSLLPTKLLDWLYTLVARNRHRLFGRRAQCVVPSPEHRVRFLDS